MSFYSLLLYNPAGLLGDRAEVEDSQNPGSKTKKRKKVKETDNEAAVAHPETRIISLASNLHPPTENQWLSALLQEPPRNSYNTIYIHTHRHI